MTGPDPTPDRDPDTSSPRSRSLIDAFRLLDGQVDPLQVDDPPAIDARDADPAVQASLEDMVEGLLALHAKLQPPVAEGSTDPRLEPRLEIPEGARRLGPYYLLEPIGRGAMGVVYRAAHPELDREVALKVLAPHIGMLPDRVSLFRREAALAAGLKHPSIVRIHDVDSVDDTWFYAMDLIEGRSLHDVLGALRAVGGAHISEVHRSVLEPNASGEGPVFASAGERYVFACARMAGQIAAALEHAHDRGVIHRDLKPSNILLDPDGKPLITDFGLATRFDSGDDHETRMGMGTPHYMAPEAFRFTGKPAPALDVYSLGVILYELLTLRLPFEGLAVAELPAAIEARTYPPVHRLNPSVDARLAAIVDRALEPDPGTRLPSAGKLRELLARYVEQLTIPEVRVSPVGRWSRRIRRHPWKYVAMALGALAVAELVWILVG